MMIDFLLLLRSRLLFTVITSSLWAGGGECALFMYLYQLQCDFNRVVSPELSKIVHPTTFVVHDDRLLLLFLLLLFLNHRYA